MTRTELTHSAIFLLVFAVLATQLLSGCKSAEQKSSYPEKVSVCDLVEPGEIDTLVGVVVDKHPTSKESYDARSGRWMSMCNYYAPDINLSVGVMLQPFSNSAQSAEKAHDIYLKNLKDNMPDYDTAVIEDIGTKAFWNEQMRQLTVFHDGHIVMITGGSREKGEDQNIDFSRDLATTVLAKL